MKLHDRENVEGTKVTIGRRVQYRTINGERAEKVSKTFTAVYLDTEGTRCHKSLGTPNKREARLRAKAIQRSLESGEILAQRDPEPATIGGVIERYTAFNENKGLAPKTLAKYQSELDRLRRFCAEQEIVHAGRFSEEHFYAYGAWLRSTRHHQGQTYTAKSVYTALTVTKQLFKWAHRTKLIPAFSLGAARLPPNRSRPQPSFTTEQVETLIERTDGATHAAIAILAYTGMRVGELQRLTWRNVRFDTGDLGAIHIRAGGSGETTKDREDRVVPIHPRIAQILQGLPRDDAFVLPGLSQKTLLTRVKKLCAELGYDRRLKVHSFRHHFASMVANSGVPCRMALEWLGHSSSQILDLYYHLHDSESQAAMKALADQTSARLGR